MITVVLFFALSALFLAVVVMYPALVLSGNIDEAAENQMESMAVQKLLDNLLCGTILHEKDPALSLSVGDIVSIKDGKEIGRVTGYSEDGNPIIAGIYNVPFSSADVLYRTGISCSEEVWERETRDFVKMNKKVQS